MQVLSNASEFVASKNEGVESHKIEKAKYSVLRTCVQVCFSN